MMTSFITKKLNLLSSKLLILGLPFALPMNFIFNAGNMP